MSDLWPSQRISTARVSKGAPVRSIVRTDWATGWIITLLTFAMVGAVALVMWPFAAQMLDSLTTFTDTIDRVTYKR